MAEYVLEFDAASIARMRALMIASASFEGFYRTVMRACVNQVKTRAMLNAPVDTGTLRRGIRGIVESPFLGVVGVLAAVPYGRRREFGYDNQTDALGRHYTMDPLPGTVSASGDLARSHMFYLRRALIDSEPFIANAFKTQLILTLNRMAV